MKKIFIILMLIGLCSCNTKEKLVIEEDSINVLDYSKKKEFDFDVYSKEYILIDLSTLEVLYEKDSDKVIYPASLTKLVTLDTVLKYVEDLDNEYSSISYRQIEYLISEDASIAYLHGNYDYSIRDLLYALILPSGADGALALENYFKEKGLNLIEEMNIQAKELGCLSSNFVNTTGLHDDDHYTSLSDLLLVIFDLLKYEDAKEILETFSYTLTDDNTVKSSLSILEYANVEALGGKTGYTPESGQSLFTLYKKNAHSYLLMTANAPGRPYLKEFLHYEDAFNIFNRLYLK